MTTVTLVPGSTDPWVCPAGVTAVQAQCWGEGGTGGTKSGTQSGGGAGGGEFAQENTVAVTPGNSYTWSTGSGGTGTNTVFPGDSLTVTAHVGHAASFFTPGAGGTGSTNSTHFDGGAGGSPSGAIGGGGGSSAGTGAAGGAGAPGTSGGAGGTAPSGGGNGGHSGTSGNLGLTGSVPGGGSGGNGNGTGAAGVAGAAGQIVLTYTATTTISGTATLSGSGSLSGAGVFAGHAALSGSGTLGAGYSVLQQPFTLSGTGTLSGSGNTGTGALLSGSGTLTAGRAVTWAQGAALSGTGTLSVGYYQGALSGTGTLGISGVRLSYPLALSGTGTLAVLQVLGGLVSASAGVAAPYAYPGTSQVAVAPPGSTAWAYLGSLGVVTALTYSFTCPGGCDAMTCTIMVPAAYRTQLFNPGWQVRITRGGHQVWDGKLDDPVPTSGGWNLTAVGAGNRGTDFLAVYTDTWPTGQPDESVNGAISRGLGWANPGVGTPSGAWYGQTVDSGAQTITALLNLICTRGGLTWMVNSQPGGVPGDDLSVFPLPSVVNRLLVCTTPVARTLGGDVNTIYIRYEISADTTSGTTSVPAVYGVTVAQNAASVAAHGEMETYIDLSDVGVMTAGAAQAVGNQVLAIYQRASFAGPFTGSYGQLLTTGGTPIDPGTDQAGTYIRPILTDYAYGGEVTPQFPVEFITGAYSWDDFAQQFSATPYVAVDASLQGLLSLANTEMTPITVAST
jgi:hypothetical protein